jgi:alkylated DNA repair dioxygenase AlkB
MTQNIITDDIPSLIRDDNLALYFDPHLYWTTESADIFQKLQKEIVYIENSTVKIHGKTIPIPRKQAAYGDHGTKYSYTGTVIYAKPWIPTLEKIKSDIEMYLNCKFNFCLVNYYEDGSKYIGYHKDDERELVQYSSIVSVSFGEDRKFKFKSDDPKKDTIDLDLNSGSMCVIMYPTNQFWKHSIPKQAKITKPRINLTFRNIDL